MTIDEINALDRRPFVESLGGVYERSPWVAHRAWMRRPFATFDELADRMNDEVDAASHEERLALLRAHPALGSRDKLSVNSAKEQMSAGLDRISIREHERLMRLNRDYAEKFGFPFLYFANGSNIAQILKELEHRSEASPEEEFEEALLQVRQIARFRLEQIIR